MARQSISFTKPNDEWLKSQVDSQEYSSKSELVNDLIRQARSQQKQIDWIKAKLEKAEKSGFTDATKEQILAEFPNAEWVTYEPFSDNNALEGTQIAFGQRLRMVNHYDLANIVVSFDDDFMSPQSNKNSVEDTYKIAETRKVSSPEDEMSRIYSIENSFTSTGSFADHRLRVKTSQIPSFIYALAARLSQDVDGLSAFDGISNEFSDHEWMDILAGDLLENAGSTVITVGSQHSPAVHAAVAAINTALGNNGNTVTYHELPFGTDRNENEAFAAAINELSSGAYSTAVILGANPVYTGPSDLNVQQALENVETKVHLSDYVTETSRLCNWHVNRAHYLESWGDGLSFTGQRSIIQPQIQPLFGGISEIELLDIILNGNDPSGYDLVRETWADVIEGDFEEQWEQILHDGIDTNSGFEAASVSLTGDLSSAIQEDLSNGPIDGIEINIKPDNKLFDGRYANNSWLQELPDSMTKVTWDNVALMSPATARNLGIDPERSFSSDEVPVVRITANEITIEIAAWVQPGHADDSITLTVGYGRENIGRVADGVGVDTYPLRTTANMFFQAAEVEEAGSTYTIACTQDHQSLEGRDMIRTASLEV